MKRYIRLDNSRIIDTKDVVSDLNIFESTTTKEKLLLTNLWKAIRYNCNIHTKTPCILGKVEKESNDVLDLIRAGDLVIYENNKAKLLTATDLTTDKRTATLSRIKKVYLPSGDNFVLVLVHVISGKRFNDWWEITGLDDEVSRALSKLKNNDGNILF